MKSMGELDGGELQVGRLSREKRMCCVGRTKGRWAELKHSKLGQECSSVQGGRRSRKG